jgi:arylsulfatase A-like enzyme
MRSDYFTEEHAPNMARLAQSGRWYSNAYANGCGTPDSFPAIFASRHALPFASMPDANADDEYALKRDDICLSQVLSQAGYETAAFVAGNPYLGRRYGYDRGFDVYEDNQPGSLVDRLTGSRLRGALRSMAHHMPWSPYPGADDVTSGSLDWLRSRRADRPFFLWVHFMDAHFPTLPPGRRGLKERQAAWSPMRGKPEENHDVLVELYASAVKHIDGSVGQLHAAIPPDTVTVVTADHGQLFGEHASYWHNGVWEQLLRVPLLVAGPEVVPAVVDDNVQLLDLAPSLLATLGLDAPSVWKGSSLRQPREPIYAISNNPASRSCTEALIHDEWKVIRFGDRSWKFERFKEPVDMVIA